MLPRTPRARELRQTQTSHEALLWQILRNRRFLNLKFRRQRPFGRYYLDFFCEELNLVIELDGVQHLGEKNVAHDTERTRFLESRGLTVLRIRNEELDDLNQAAIRLDRAIREIHSRKAT